MYHAGLRTLMTSCCCFWNDALSIAGNQDGNRELNKTDTQCYAAKKHLKSLEISPTSDIPRTTADYFSVILVQIKQN